MKKRNRKLELTTLARLADSAEKLLGEVVYAIDDTKVYGEKSFDDAYELLLKTREKMDELEVRMIERISLRDTQKNAESIVDNAEPKTYYFDDLKIGQAYPFHGGTDTLGDNSDLTLTLKDEFEVEYKFTDEYGHTVKDVCELESFLKYINPVDVF